MTGVEVAGQPVEPGPDGVIEAAAPVAGEIRLGPDQAYLTIQYAGLHFSNPAANTYRYRMAGLFDDWREVGTAREATFSALRPAATRSRSRPPTPTGSASASARRPSASSSARRGGGRGGRS